MIHEIRGFVVPLVLGACIALLVLGFFVPTAWWGLVVFGPLALLGVYVASHTTPARAGSAAITASRVET